MSEPVPDRCYACGYAAGPDPTCPECGRNLQHSQNRYERSRDWGTWLAIAGIITVCVPILPVVLSLAAVIVAWPAIRLVSDQQGLAADKFDLLWVLVATPFTFLFALVCTIGWLVMILYY